jgi:hypothetical protein
MKKLTILLILAALICLNAQGWEKSGSFSLLLSQSYYSDNWEGTEKGNVNWTASFNFIMQKQLNSMLHDKNTLLLSFGQTHSEEMNEDGDYYWQKPETSTDKIDFENLLTFTLQKFVDPFASGRWESSFYDGSIPEDTYFFNPNILTFSLGAKKILINQEIQNLETRLGAAWKNYFNQHPDIDYQNNAGVEFVMSYWYLFPAKLGKFDSTLRLYQALTNSEDNGTDEWKTIDMEFISNLNFRLSSYIGLKVYFEMLYDKELIDKIRYQENLGINLSYSLY